MVSSRRAAQRFVFGWFARRWGVRALACIGLSSPLPGCGGASPSPKTAQHAAGEENGATVDPVLAEALRQQGKGNFVHRVPEHRPAAGGDIKTEPAHAQAEVRGITGSLTAFEVEQAMHSRHDALLACVQARPRALGHVAGNIAFHVDVDGRGKVERVQVMESDLGYMPLENCLASAVAAAPFPAPAGAQRAEARWSMGVDPLRRTAESMDPVDIEPVIARNAEATYDKCGVDKKRRFVVNGYIARANKLKPVTVRLPWSDSAGDAGSDSDRLACLSEALEQWNGWPGARHVRKVGFELRWVAAPAPRRGRTKARRR